MKLDTMKPGLKILILCQDDLEAIPYHRVYPLIDYLRERVEKLDILFYDRCYEKNVTGTGAKLYEGIKDFLTKSRIHIRREGNVTYYGVRRLPLDGTLSTMAQDPWVYHQFNKVNQDRYDLAISEAPGPAQIAIRMKKEGRVRQFIYDDTDYFPGFATGNRAKRIEQQELLGIQNADRVICVSRRLINLRRQQGAKQLEYIPNGVDFNSYRKAMLKNKPDGNHFIYAGSLEHWAGMDIFLKGLILVKDEIPSLRVTIIGEGESKPGLEKLVQESGLQERVIFTGKLPPQELPGLFAQADYGIILPQPSKLWDYACPLKLFQYMAAGLPVIATDTGELADLVKAYQVGVSVEYTPEAVAEGIRSLVTQPEMMKTYSENGIRESEPYSWHLLMQRYEKVIQELVNANRD